MALPGAVWTCTSVTLDGESRPEEPALVGGLQVVWLRMAGRTVSIVTVEDALQRLEDEPLRSTAKPTPFDAEAHWSWDSPA